MTTKAAAVEETIMIPWKQIHVDDEFNYRLDLPEVKKMAASLEAEGQLQPIVVKNGGSEDKPYTLVIGGRRMAAYELLGWTGREIRAEVRPYKDSEPLQPYFDNWHSNEEIEGTNPMHRAEFIDRLNKGFPLGADKTATPLSIKEIKEKLNLKSDDQVRRYLNIFNNIDADVQKKARKNDVPLRLLIAIARIEGTGKGDAKEESKATSQMKALDEYLEEQKALEEEGRKKGVRSDKGTKKGKKGAKGKGGDGEGAAAKPLVNQNRKVNDKGHTPSLYLAALMLKVAGATAAQAEALNLQIETVEFFLGKRKKFPGLNAADLKAAQAEDEEEEETEETEEEES